MTRINLVSFAAAGLFACTTGVTTYLWRGAEAQRSAAESRVAALAQEAARAGNVPGRANTAAAEGPSQAAGAEPNPQRQGQPGDAKALQAVKTIKYLESRLAEARREVAVSKSEAAQYETKLQSQTAAAAKAAADLHDVREEAEAAKRNASTVESELRNRTDALAKAEAAYKQANDRLAKMAADSAATTRQTTTAAREIDDLSRRRENYMTSLQRRFRDVTDLYRGFALDQQNRGSGVAGGNNSNPPMMQAGDLSRIQNAIAQAEDELRQVQTLNARIATLLKTK